MRRSAIFFRLAPPLLSVALIAMTAVTLAACDKGSPLGPSPIGADAATTGPAPLPPPAPAPNPSPADLTLSGHVRSGSRPVTTSKIEVVSGANAGASATTDDEGRYSLTALSGGSMVVRASAEGYEARTADVFLDTNKSTDFVLSAAGTPSPTPPPTNTPPPAPPPPAPPSNTVAVTGKAIDLLTQTALSGISAAGDGLATAESDGNGTFRLTSSAPMDRSVRQVRFAGSRIVERVVQVELPARDMTVSLIPSTFDLAAFDQMFRSPGLRRWTTAPPLLLEQRVVQFTSADMTQATGRSTVMTGADADGLVADLTRALAPLTANTFRAFQRVSAQTSPEGATVQLLNPGVITVVRVAGLTAATGKWGWSRWFFSGAGTVTAGLMMLDDEFDRSGSPFVHTLRAHELGHALGYDHVTATASVMNAEARLDPTPFDLDACRIAFQRQPGSRSPDIDAAISHAPQSAGAGTWSAPIH